MCLLKSPQDGCYRVNSPRRPYIGWGQIPTANIAREPGYRKDSSAFTGMWMVSTQGCWLGWKSMQCSQVLSGKNTDEPSFDNRLHHGGPARGNAARAEGRFPRVGAKILGASCPPGRRSSFGWMRSRSHSGGRDSNELFH